jgi:hypothetical protein
MLYCKLFTSTTNKAPFVQGVPGSSAGVSGVAGSWMAGAVTPYSATNRLLCSRHLHSGPSYPPTTCSGPALPPSSASSPSSSWPATSHSVGAAASCSPRTSTVRPAHRLQPRTAPAGTTATLARTGIQQKFKWLCLSSDILLSVVLLFCMLSVLSSWLHVETTITRVYVQHYG